MSNKWVIKDAEGNVTNACIKADETFVAANFDHYEAYVKPTEEEASADVLARDWRDAELKNTDFIVPTTDHPQHAAYMAYRISLRGWPSTADVPATKPTL